MKFCSCSLEGTNACKTCSNYPYSIHITNDLIESVSSVQPEQKKDEWISISERLPEEEGIYLVTDDAGGVKTVHDDEFLHYADGTPLWLCSQNVTAWMPAPEPYRGEQDDTD